MIELDYQEFWKWELNAVENYTAPVYRAFRFPYKTVSYGRHIEIQDVVYETKSLNPEHLIKRPTGGGWVFHEDDICFSIIFRTSKSLKEIYRTLSSYFLKFLDSGAGFPARVINKNTASCFENVAAFDLVKGGTKILGCALARMNGVYLYQCSIKEKFDKIKICLEDLEL